MINWEKEGHYMSANLLGMAERVIGKYEEYRNDITRREACGVLAAEYEIDPPEAILCITDARLKLMDLGERAAKLGISEEELLTAMLTPGYKRLMADYERVNLSLLRLLSHDKLRGAVGKERLDADGVEDFSVELALLGKAPQEQVAPQVNTQVNIGTDLFEQARAQVMATQVKGDE